MRAAKRLLPLPLEDRDRPPVILARSVLRPVHITSGSAILSQGPRPESRNLSNKFKPGTQIRNALGAPGRFHHQTNLVPKMPVSILPCTSIDGPAIGTLNVHAFWTDRTWVRLWPGKSLDFVATQAAKRGTHMLLSDQGRRRHLKAVDHANDDRIVGYARWQMPLFPHPSGGEVPERFGCNLWPDARVPDVPDNERQRAQAASEAADWDFDRALDVLDPPMLDMKEKWMGVKPYICSSRPLHTRRHWLLIIG